MDLLDPMMKSYYKKLHPPLRTKSGFTLIEVVLAVGILVFVLCGILATYMSCLELMATSKNMTLATNAAQRKIEEIRDYNFYNIYSDYNNQTFSVDEMPAGDSSGVIYVNNSDPELLQITVSVCWRQRAGRIIGEDLDLDGSLDSGEDSNGNNIIDSPVELITLSTPR
jgi:prepilin-type N-terminal cleavage/methylation domain-containing protein